MRLARKHLLLGLLLLALAACANTQTGCANLFGAGLYCLQTTATSEHFYAQQRLDIKHSEQNATLIVELEVDADGMRFAALTPFGHKLVQAHYDNERVHADSLPDERLDPALLFAFLQIALWPAESVRKGLEPSLVLEESAGERAPYNSLRIIVPQAEMVIEITTLESDSAQ